MTKEELEKEVEEKLKEDICANCFDKDNIDDCLGCSHGNGYIIGYHSGVESREKRITELESTNKAISKECHNLVASLEKSQKERLELKEQNKNLQKRMDWNISEVNAIRDNLNRRFDENVQYMNKLEKENAELKEELKKWKDEWEMKEND